MNYYSYKSGSGNCFLPHLTGYKSGNSHTLPGLYVGFDDIEPVAKTTTNPIHVRIRNGGDETFVQAGAKARDDDHISHIFHKNIRGNVRLIAYDKRHLIVMKIPDEANSLIIWERENHQEFKIFQNIIIGIPHLKDRYKNELTVNAAKFLPVTIEHIFPRDSLYLSLDSLFVFQYLNRGTCRPINRIGTTDHEGYGNLELILGTLIKPGETPYGAFMRLYIDRLCQRSDPRFDEILASSQDSARLVLATLNPILFETLAFYLCLDLDLVPESANGKGLDVIDVRARCKPNGSMDATIKGLKKLGVELHADLRKLLENNQPLSIQCKAYSGETPNAGNDFLMFRRGENKSRKMNELFASDLENIQEFKSEFTYVKEFIASQTQTMRQQLKPHSGSH